MGTRGTTVSGTSYFGCHILTFWTVGQNKETSTSVLFLSWSFKPYQTFISKLTPEQLRWFFFPTEITRLITPHCNRKEKQKNSTILSNLFTWTHRLLLLYTSVTKPETGDVPRKWPDNKKGSDIQVTHYTSGNTPLFLSTTSAMKWKCHAVVHW